MRVFKGSEAAYQHMNEKHGGNGLEEAEEEEEEEEEIETWRGEEAGIETYEEVEAQESDDEDFDAISVDSHLVY
jgi:hypothetical protein